VCTPALADVCLLHDVYAHNERFNSCVFETMLGVVRAGVDEKAVNDALCVAGDVHALETLNTVLDVAVSPFRP
jgi:hypothetical protein